MGADHDPMSTSEKIKAWLEEDVPLNPLNLKTWDWLGRALAWVMKEIGKKGAMLATMGAEVLGFGLFSLADVLKQFIDKYKADFYDLSYYTLRFVTKLCKLFGFPVPAKAEDVSKKLLEKILRRLEHEMEQKARQAIREHNRNLR